MSKSTRFKTRAYLFEEEELKESLLEIIFSTNEEIILHIQFRRSRGKIIAAQKIIEKIVKTLFFKSVPDQFQHSEKSNLFKDPHFKQEIPPGLASLI